MYTKNFIDGNLLWYRGIKHFKRYDYIVDFFQWYSYGFIPNFTVCYNLIRLCLKCHFFLHK